MAYVPVAFVSALFRPLPFDIRNAPTLLAGLEAAIFVALALRALGRGGPARLVQVTAASPLLVMSAVFFLLFAVAVGLTSGNLGTLSRYRAPMLPFYVLWLLAVGAPVERPVAADAPIGAPRAATSGSG